MSYIGKYQGLVELSHSDSLEVKQKADNWLRSIELQGTAELEVSAFLLDLAIKNVKEEITSADISQRLKEHYGDTLL